MTAQKEVTFWCDGLPNKPCNHWERFNGGIQIAESEAQGDGWAIFHRDGKKVHICPHCVREMNKDK